jgi:hypothetical protein
MAIVVGLLLVPIGAAIGTSIVGTLMMLGGSGPDPLGDLRFLAFFGMSFGSLFAAPVTAGIIPAAYAVLRRRAALRTIRLGMIGLVAGMLPIWAFAIAEWPRTGNLHITDGGLPFLSAVAAVAGLACALIFALVMRRLRPNDWPPAEK